MSTPDIIVSTPGYYNAMISVTVRDDTNSTNELFIGGEIHFRTDGTIQYSPNNNEESKKFFDSYKREILKEAAGEVLFHNTLAITQSKYNRIVHTLIGMKQIFIPCLLKAFKQYHSTDKELLRMIIHLARSEGYDYPELKAVEKSLGTLKESNSTLTQVWKDELEAHMESGNGISQRTISKVKEYLTPEEIKPIVLKSLLKRVRHQIPLTATYAHSTIHKYISNLRAGGIDYPEFAAIEKSLNSVSEELHEAVVTPEKSDITKLKSILKKALALKNPNFYHIALVTINKEICWATSLTKLARLDLSNIDEELHTLIMKFTLAWYKNVIISYEHPIDLLAIKEWLKYLKYSKFSPSDFEILRKSMNAKKRKIKESAVAKDAVLRYDQGYVYMGHHGYDYVKFEDKEAYVKVLLQKLKEHDLWAVRAMIHEAREHGYDYPEFDVVEKSLSKINESKDFMDHRISITTSKGFVGVIVRKDDLIGRIVDREYGHPYAQECKIRIKLEDKNALIKFILSQMKIALKTGGLKALIEACREAGYDYPEFAAIEKSLGSLKEAAHPGARRLFTFALKNGDFACCTFINNKDYFEVSIPDDYNWVDYSETLKREPFTKENVIKFLLKMLKEDSEVIQFQRIIAFLRSEGHDWPELEAIEKSLKSN